MKGTLHASGDRTPLPPEKELPDHYRPWMEIANRLPHLIGSHQLRAQVNEMPLLNCQFLTGYREQRLAHLVLTFITMGYVWQDGEAQPKEVLPRTLALPLVEVSRNLGLPPILLHSDVVLANWATRNPGRPLEIRNLDPIVLFPGGESLRGFILVTVLVEKAAVPGIKALVQAVNAVLLPSPDSLLQALQQLRLSIKDITRALGQMHVVFWNLSLDSWTSTKAVLSTDYVDPDIFYAVIRIFFSGWKDNPAMPAGLLYEGVSKEPLHYSGASAAQSTVLHAFDEFLGVRHSKESADFLHRMRDYMPPSHRAFIEEIHSAPSLRDHILSSGNSQLLTAYNQCVEALAALRSYHLAMVTKYLITAAPKAKGRKTSHLPGPPQALEERGTGGTAVVRFLKSVRDKTIEAILHQSG
ncbi:indoleamine 2,3-dioxygenase 2 isoform X2 [Phocoena sinus]|uniref:indoleamine 2,3-dioxygenase 2 isoform X2 n=1 Tax=Phocoena sinus TaxID=42100 RepID=UPI0013C52FD0|nr:indoleamine 2,3-dioxygenase 2 isoform X2 [Phocoena sinus]XP_032474470.1 indoleamine 2,3-dioxygenase 2 isoform X2 [Phocoena sinus]